MPNTRNAVCCVITISLFVIIGSTSNQLAAQLCDCDFQPPLGSHRTTNFSNPIVSSPPVNVSSGPGTEMTRIINRLGMGSDCGRCQALAAEMDQGGPEWVQQNFNYVVARTIGNAENLGHRMGPVQQLGVRRIVRRSIRLSR